MPASQPTSRAEPLTAAPSMMATSPPFQSAVPSPRLPARDDVLVEPVEVVLVLEQRVEAARLLAQHGRQAPAACRYRNQASEHAGDRQPDRRPVNAVQDELPPARGTPRRRCPSTS